LRLAVVLLVLASLFLGRGPILHAVGALLVAEDADEVVTADVLFDLDLDPAQLAQRYRASPRPLLLLRWAPSRLVLTGLVPPACQRVQAALERCGVDRNRVQELPAQAHGFWDGARALHAWLADHPAARVAVLCERFDSRRLRYILDCVLGPDTGRAAVVALADENIHEANWWRSKAGFFRWFSRLLQLGFTYTQGEGIKQRLTWDLDASERSLR
jgi:hypothetical protein